MKTYTAFYITEDGYDRLEEWCGPDRLEPDKLNRKYELYAMTSSKIYAKIFRKTRDPKYFRERQITVEDEELFSFKTKYSEYFIQKLPLRCVVGEGDDAHVKSIVVPIPVFERRHIEMDWPMILSTTIDDMDWVANERIFHMIINSGGSILDPIVSYALDVIGYNGVLFEYDISESIPWNDEKYFHELNGYRKLYGFTYRKKGIMKLCEYGNFI